MSFSAYFRTAIFKKLVLLAFLILSNMQPFMKVISLKILASFAETLFYQL